MVNNPVLAEWEMQVRVADKRQLAEQLRLERLGESPKLRLKDRPAGLSTAHPRGSGAFASRSSSLVGMVRRIFTPWFSHPPLWRRKSVQRPERVV